MKLKTTPKWLFIQRNSESTAATNRQTSAGTFIAINDSINESTPNPTIFYVVCHYDISLRGRQFQQTLSMFKTPQPVIRVREPDRDDEKASGEFYLVKKK